jgi:exopolysaccharide biosynthesis polyprenyl glycosylphosphotransferase
MASTQTLVAAEATRAVATRTAIPRLRIPERRLLLACFDGLIAGGMLLLAYEIWKSTVHPGADNMASVPWTWVLAAAVSWLVLSWLAGSYDLNVADRTVGILKRTITVSALAVGAGLGGYLLFPKTYPRPSLAMALAGVPLGVLAWRLLYSSAFHRPASALRILVLGNNHTQNLSEITRNSRYFRVVAEVSEEQSASVDLIELLNSLRIHRIVVAPRLRLTDRMVAMLSTAIERGVEVIDFNSAYEEMAGKVAVDHAGDHWLAALPTRVTTSALEEAAVRWLDIVGALIGGAATIVLLPLVAAAVHLSSRGPVLYRQRRVGRAGREFTIYKFRTMIVDAETGGARWAKPDDERVTSVGRFLRGTHLDELPQLWNILLGDMSLVGPRPERPEFTRALADQIPFYRLRLMVRPGLTGLKQLKVGYAATVDEHLDVLRHDLYYIKHRSLALNLAIIAQTLGLVMGRDGR